MYLAAHPLAAPPVARTSQRVALATLRLWDTPREPQRTLGGIPILDAVGGIVGGLFQADAAKSQAKQARKAAEAAANATVKQAQIQADAYKSATLAQMKAAQYAADMEFRAASKKADTDLAAVKSQYGAALDALQQQRLAAIDQQIASLVQNTTGAMFSLSGRGLAEAGSVSRTYVRSGALAVVVLGLGTMLLIRAPKIKRKAKGKDKRAPLAIGSAAEEAA